MASSSPSHSENSPLLARNPLASEAFPPEGVTLPRRPRVLELIVFVYCAAAAGLMPIASQYVLAFSGQQLGLITNSSQAGACNSSDHEWLNSSNYRNAQAAQELASSWMLYRTIAFCLASLPSILLLSSASDAIGRKPPLVLPCIGGVIDSAVLLLTIWFALPLQFIVASAAVSGITGGIGCIFAGALAFVADTTRPQRLPLRVTVIESLAGIGAAVMSLAIGWWIQVHGFLIPQAFCTLLYIAALLLTVLILPEVRRCTISGLAIVKATKAAATGIASLLQLPAPVPILYCLSLLGMLLYSSCLNGTVDLIVLYLSDYPLCFDPELIGYFQSARLLLLQVGMIALVHSLHKHLSPLALAAIGLLSAAGGFGAMSLASSWPLLFASTAINCFGFVPIPMFRAFSSLLTPSHRQGSMFSLFGVLQMIAILGGDIVFTEIYKRTLNWFAGFAFCAVTLCAIASLLLTVAAFVVFRCYGNRRVVDADADADSKSVNS